MDNHLIIRKHLKLCTYLIEQKIIPGHNHTLTKREFELIIETIFEKTGVLISLSTIRRIWNGDFKTVPHRSTLDSLADIAGYSSWQVFTNENPISEIKRQTNHLKKIIISLLVLLFIVAFGVLTYHFGVNKPEVYENIEFSYLQKNDTMVPSVVVFNYDVTNIDADSFFIVESSKDYETRKLLNKKGQMTSSYHYPGNYEAFLIAEDLIIAKLNVKIRSKKWVGLINYENITTKVPYYIRENEMNNNNKLIIDAERLNKNGISITEDICLTFSKTVDSIYLSKHDSFIFEAEVCIIKTEPARSCPEIISIIFFDDNICYVPLVQYGGEGNLQVKFGNTIKTSNDSDLTGLGCDIFKKQKITIRKKNTKIKILINDNHVITFSDTT